ncbi:MAG TPA: cbb3-type cytochrome c oxidase N-terminal domain-containing protein [Pirellulaceae bacterium]|nr:cbb3-type cytochrome c oxidase N-terminal domain-containing protein [Pirellulaceae bacterium]HMO92676.1 cbb3-type cytochrome c oxidase N-terminal domain-containing protein [Pirellulaceae bacterium]HMP70576.1 cbb3-type cytochrome c oxidase N-terminal domain-containing protein [Pirellulaceae bacterium]
MSEYQERLDEVIHSYDGIQEYDNPLPGWWTFLFAATVVFAIFYVIYFHSGVEGRSIHDDLMNQMATIAEVRYAEIGELTPDRETLLQYMHDEKWLAVGQVAYKANCVSCHGANGEGLVGPNLTDRYWKNVKSIEDIATVVATGAGNGAMPGWKTRLHPNQVVLVSAYVASLKGTVQGGKGPEGNNLIESWE